MKIFYDGLIYEMYSARPGGISNFFDHLISSVSVQHRCLLTSSSARSIQQLSGPGLRIARHTLSFRPHGFSRFIRHHSFAVRSTLFRPDIIHATYYSTPAIYSAVIPVVYTAYDMIHEKWSHQLDPQGLTMKSKRKCFERAAAIPCISESTRRDLLELYPFLESKTSVIHLAGGLKYLSYESNSVKSQDCSEIYILYVGARHSYKNFDRLALAFSRLNPKFAYLRLKVVGAPFGSSENDLFDSLNIAHRVDLYQDASDQSLYSLYRHATAFVYPSLYEGFGIPPLEAMSCDTPVLASNASSVPEVVGDAAVLFDPRSVDSIKAAIEQILISPEMREDLRRKGRRQCSLFSWEKTASLYTELYAKVLSRIVRSS